jgi:hypothetical protein
MRAILIFFAFVAACESADTGQTNSTNGGTNGGATNGGGGGNKDLGDTPLDDLAVDRDAFFIQDPPVMYCGLDAGGFPAPSPPGGTLACPDDKNLEGCPCPTIGETAPCWPGRRANRNLGQCKDGTTTCQQSGEVNQAWGPCVGAVLPDPNATAGAAACECFSSGYWDVTNLVVCGSINNTTYTGFSGPLPDSMGMIDCSMMMPAGSNWSDDTLKVDCAGHFKLCYTVKAGKFDAKTAGDCVLTKVCAEGDYLNVNQTQPWTPVPSWVSNDSACVMAFFTTGGYGEMSVVGTSLTCEPIPDHVFQTVRYCGQNEPGCMAGGGGPFGP